ncbi:VP [Broome densovirus 1]|uniref:VP n=1 Tax=Broome densovirus TaxID=3070203 RepID=A0A7D6C540_9VIRU|nr:VP [Broome densovirus 1]QLJ83485.1 VP [Broome densovirus 1]
MSKYQVAWTLQEGTQRKPAWVYKYNKLAARNKQKAGPSKQQRGDAQPAKRPRVDNPEPEEQEQEQEQASNSSPPEQSEMSQHSEEDQEMASADIDPVTAGGSGAAGARSVRSVGAGGNKGASAGVRGSVQWPTLPKLGASVNLEYYHKSYLFRISSKDLSYKNVTNEDDFYTLVSFPIHEFPLNKLAFYLSKEQIAKILEECTDATVKKCRVTIHTKTATLPFETNASNAYLANNNVGIWCTSWKKDINKYRKGTYPGISSLVGERIWGSHLSALPRTNGEWSSAMGALSAETVVKDYDFSFMFSHTHDQKHAILSSDNILQYNEHIFPWRYFLTNFRNATFEEGLYDVTEWTPNNGTVHNVSKNADSWATYSLANQMNYRSPYDSIPPFGAMAMRTSSQPPKNRPPMNDLGAGFIDHDVPPATIFPKPRQRRRYTITEAQELQIGDDPLGSIPCASIGIDPKYTGELKNQSGKIIDAKMEIQVRYECWIEERRGTSYQHPYGGSLVQPDYRFPKMVLGYNTADSIPQSRDITTIADHIPTIPGHDRVGYAKLREGPIIDVNYMNTIGNRTSYAYERVVEAKKTAKKNDKFVVEYNLRSRKVQIAKVKQAKVVVPKEHTGIIRTSSSTDDQSVDKAIITETEGEVVVTPKTLIIQADAPASVNIDSPSSSVKRMKSSTSAKPTTSTTTTTTPVLTDDQPKRQVPVEDMKFFDSLSAREKHNNMHRPNQYIWVLVNNKWNRTTHLNPYYYDNVLTKENKND